MQNKDSAQQCIPRTSKIVNALKKNIITYRIIRLIRYLLNIISYGNIFPLVYYVDDNKKFAYLSISKAANTSIKACVFKMEEQSYRDIHNKLYLDRSRIIEMPIWINAHQKNKYSSYFKFTFVRNPFSRLVSNYENKYHSDKDILGLSGVDMYYNIYLMGYLRKDDGFSEFARKISKIPLILADDHFAPQSRNIFDRNGEKRVDYIGRFEHINDDWKPLMEKYDFSPLPHYNKTKKGNWMDYYNLETAQLMYKYYKKDIKEFDYEESYKDLINYIEKRDKDQNKAAKNLYK